MSDVLSSRVLMLNSSYSPIRITTAKNAFIKLFANVAEVVTVEDSTYCNYDFNSWAEISELRKEMEELDIHDDLVFTSKLTLVVPRIIRMLTYNKIPKQNIKLTRRNIYARDDNTCQYCGKRFLTNKLNIDHVIPKKLGGENTWKNLVCSCFKCNSKKASRTPEQASMKLIKNPVKPKYSSIYKIHIGSERYSSWKNFISEKYWNCLLV